MKIHAWDGLLVAKGGVQFRELVFDRSRRPG